MMKNENKVKVTISKEFGQMFGLKKTYYQTTVVFHISDLVKSDFTADINQG